MMGVNIIFLVGVFVILLIGVVAAVLAVCLKKVNAQERPEEMPNQQDFQNHQWMTEEQNRIIQDQNRIIQEQVQQQINQDHMRNM
ncbi:hypothetical protein [Massiliimalia massiliensis]|uniref:hypothetical protein n=1 Tax=Massiliimalia massiliensis TaxID=1852384 RepID=UPI000984B350|nr:hypothetical protein [Massiliimalia massiliensis]